jgi:general secretion pathway protein K
LLAVLWLSAALSAIALTLALTVRAELERASGAVDSVRAYYLAAGAIEHFQMLLSTAGSADPRNSDAAGFKPGQRRLRWDTPNGTVDLEIIGEGGKLNVYTTEPATLTRLFVLLGLDAGRAEAITAGIAGRRSNRSSSFSGSQASFTDLEDLVAMPGVTPEVFYGWWVRPGAAGAAAESNGGRLMQLGGLAQNLTVMDSGIMA